MVKKASVFVILLILGLSPVLAEPCGDVNSNGVIDIIDALMTAQYIVGLDPQPYDVAAADVSGDGNINVVDALQTAQYYVGLITILVGCEPTDPPTEPPGTPPPETIVMQAEDATWENGAVESDHSGYTGSGYVNTVNASGTWIEWSLNLANDTPAVCDFRYASTDARGMDLIVNGTTEASLGFADSGSWTNWAVEEAPTVNLIAGANTIRLTATGSSGAPNMDKMDITMNSIRVTAPPTEPPTPPPTAPPTPTPCTTNCPPGPTIGIYRTFEKSLTYNNSYSNKFTDVELQVTYNAPSGRTIDFFGFFDGDGNGGGNRSSGNVWKMRFMPDEYGTWHYTWSWSDGTPGGQDLFIAVPEGAGKGILHAYENNPYWFAYNGTEPVFIKSYYESGHGAIAQPFDWIIENVYQPMLDHGYNHLQVNWLMPLCCEGQYYHDGPPQSITSIRLYDNGQASTTMRFNVWYMMEEHVQWLNDRNVGLHMFLGFNGGRNGGPNWKDLSSAEKEFYVKYVVARLAPYACIAGWNYVWEVSGSDTGGELGLARLLQQYDIFNHLRTYEDEFPTSNEWHRPEYTFAATENHGVIQSGKDREYWKEGYSHHRACLVSYEGKPVYMSEGNALWRRFWHPRIGADQDDLLRAAWACTTAASSFCWNGHASEYDLEAHGPDGLPFFGYENAYKLSADYIDILSDVMNGEVEFFKMTPGDSLLSGHDDRYVWCLAELGRQYLVYTIDGRNFNLNLAAGEYNNNMWINARTGDSQSAAAVSGSGNRSFSPPNTSTDWVLILRS